MVFLSQITRKLPDRKVFLFRLSFFIFNKLESEKFLNSPQSAAFWRREGRKNEKVCHDRIANRSSHSSHYNLCISFHFLSILDMGNAVINLLFVLPTRKRKKINLKFSETLLPNSSAQLARF
jgi:hypothetical protein